MTQIIPAIRSAIAQDRPVSTEDILALCDEVERMRAEPTEEMIDVAAKRYHAEDYDISVGMSRQDFLWGRLDKDTKEFCREVSRSVVMAALSARKP